MSTKRKMSDEISILIIFISIIVVISIIIPRFRSIKNLLTVTRQFSLIAIVAMGQSIVLISGGFDLSVGSIAGLAGITSGHLMVTFGLPIWISIIAGIIVGILCGLINGLLISKVRISPLIATLATSWIFSGAILVFTKGWPVTNFPKRFEFLGQGYVLGIPLPIIIMLLICVILYVFLSQTIFGRQIYAKGCNQKASRLAGLNTDFITIVVFILSGALSAVGGIVLASRMGSAMANAGSTWALPSIAAAVIGGVSLAGGKGNIFGVLIGVALLGVINNILVLLHISSYWQRLISGLIVIGAVSIDAVRKYRESLEKTKIIK